MNNGKKYILIKEHIGKKLCLNQEFEDAN